jgi:hypothetical protein
MKRPKKTNVVTWFHKLLNSSVFIDSKNKNLLCNSKI